MKTSHIRRARVWNAYAPGKVQLQFENIYLFSLNVGKKVYITKTFTKTTNTVIEVTDDLSTMNFET